MKAYGHKTKGPCVCEMCGASAKKAIKRRARMEAKLEIRDELKEAPKKIR